MYKGRWVENSTVDDEGEGGTKGEDIVKGEERGGWGRELDIVKGEEWGGRGLKLDEKVTCTGIHVGEWWGMGGWGGSGGEGWRGDGWAQVGLWSQHE
jgi:hypothetical protein